MKSVPNNFHLSRVIAHTYFLELAHFIVVCSVTRPLNDSKAGGNLVGHNLHVPFDVIVKLKQSVFFKEIMQVT